MLCQYDKLKTAKMKTIKQRNQLLKICDQILNDIKESDNTQTQKTLAYVAITVMKNKISEEIKVANSFLIMQSSK